MTLFRKKVKLPHFFLANLTLPRMPKPTQPLTNRPRARAKQSRRHLDIRRLCVWRVSPKRHACYKQKIFHRMRDLNSWASSCPHYASFSNHQLHNTFNSWRLSTPVPDLPPDMSCADWNLAHSRMGEESCYCSTSLCSSWRMLWRPCGRCCGLDNSEGGVYRWNLQL